MRKLIAVVCISLMMMGCASVKMQKLSKGEAPVVVGPAVRENRTPLDSAMTCYNAKLADKLAGKKLQVAVGEIKDYTGKLSETQGAAITQGGSLMLFSGLYKLKDSVNIHDRFDMRVTDAELRYIGLKQLGDGKNHEVNGQKVPWMPYFGGSVKKSDYTILGGITEVNYNIHSGGFEFRINQLGPAARVYTMNVAIDLRLINTQTLEVVSAVSLQKQFTGYEVGFELFRFYNNDLYDVNIGNKSQEPLQLGIRAIIEESVLRLLADATGVPYSACMREDWSYANKQDVDVNKPLPGDSSAGKPTAKQNMDGSIPLQSDSAVGKPAREQNIDSNKAVQSDSAVVKPAAELPSISPNQEIKKLIDQQKHPLKGKGGGLK
jgi:curli biogenesis system outer membrane secretion channel CsgG